MIMLDDDYVIK